MYTPSDVSRLLGIPQSTLRRWAVRFSDFLSPEAHQRKRKYTQQDLDVLSQVQTLAAQNYPLDDIAQKLSQVIDIESSQRPEESSTALALPGITKEFDRLRDLLEQIQVERQQDRQEIAALRDQVQQLVDEIEESRRPFWEKLFKRPKPPEEPEE